MTEFVASPRPVPPRQKIRMRMIKRALTTTESAMEPRQPIRFEKKKNISWLYPSFRRPDHFCFGRSRRPVGIKVPMTKPQQSELRRSGRGATDDDSAKIKLEAAGEPGSGGNPHPIPEANQPGHHPEKEQDKPDT